MDSDDAEEVNIHTERKYVKDAKVGEGTYAVVYSGKCQPLYSTFNARQPSDQRVFKQVERYQVDVK
jgi:hypothetical protein